MTGRRTENQIRSVSGATHRRALAAIVERHRGEEKAVLSFSHVSDLPDDLPDWVRAEESVKRCAAAVLLEAKGVAVTPTPTCLKKRNRRGKEGRSCLDYTCSRYTWASRRSTTGPMYMPVSEEGENGNA